MFSVDYVEDGITTSCIYQCLTEEDIDYEEGTVYSRINHGCYTYNDDELKNFYETFSNNDVKMLKYCRCQHYDECNKVQCTEEGLNSVLESPTSKQSTTGTVSTHKVGEKTSVTKGKVEKPSNRGENVHVGLSKLALIISWRWLYSFPLLIYQKS